MDMLEHLKARRTVRKILNVEDEAGVVALLAMGYPAEVPPAPPRDPHTAHLRDVS